MLMHNKKKKKLKRKHIVKTGRKRKPDAPASSSQS